MSRMACARWLIVPASPPWSSSANPPPARRSYLASRNSPGSIEVLRSTLVATVRDLTLLKRGELELRETHERLQDSERLYRDQATPARDAVRLASRTPSSSSTPAATSRSWNRGAQHLFGYAAEDIIGKDARLLLPEPHASQLSPLSCKRAIGIKTGRIEMEGRHGSGRIIPIEVSIRGDDHRTASDSTWPCYTTSRCVAKSSA